MWWGFYFTREIDRRIFPLNQLCFFTTDFAIPHLRHMRPETLQCVPISFRIWIAIEQFDGRSRIQSIVSALIAMHLYRNGIS